MSFRQFADRNELFCTVSVIVLGVVAITYGVLAYYAFEYRTMAQRGYIEVQTVGTVTTHWEKAKP